MGDREKLFEQNRRLVYYLLHKYGLFSLAPRRLHDDLVSEAMVGLWEACCTYQPDRGVRFATYAAKVVLNEVRMFLRSERSGKALLNREAIRLEKPLGRDRDGDCVTLGELLVAPEERRGPDPARYPVLAEWLAGFGQREIARRLGRSQPWVHRVIRREARRYLEEEYEEPRQWPAKTPHPVAWDLRDEPDGEEPVKTYRLAEEEVGRLPLAPEQVKEAIRLYQGGLAACAIAPKLKTTTAQVVQALTKAGVYVKRRPRRVTAGKTKTAYTEAPTPPRPDLGQIISQLLALGATVNVTVTATLDGGRRRGSDGAEDVR